MIFKLGKHFDYAISVEVKARLNLANLPKSLHQFLCFYWSVRIMGIILRWTLLIVITILRLQRNFVEKVHHWRIIPVTNFSRTEPFVGYGRSRTLPSSHFTLGAILAVVFAFKVLIRPCWGPCPASYHGSLHLGACKTVETGSKRHPIACSIHFSLSNG